MAVTGELLVQQIIAFQHPHPDVRKPSGLWYGEGSVTGDASGGNQGVLFDFTKRWIETHVASLEDVYISASGAVAVPAAIEIAQPFGAVLSAAWKKDSLEMITSAGSIVSRGRDIRLPVYFAHALPYPGQGAPDIRLGPIYIACGNTNAMVLYVKVWGFWWEVKQK